MSQNRIVSHKTANHKAVSHKAVNHNPAKNDEATAKIVDEGIKAASDKHGMPYQYLNTVAQIESTKNPNKVNGSAVGLFQIQPDAARAVKMKLEDRTDPLKSANAAAEYTKINLFRLWKNGVVVDLNKDPVLGYLAFQQGATGLSKIVKAADKGEDVKDPAIRKNMNSNGGRGKTPKEFLEFWKTRYKMESLKVNK